MVTSVAAADPEKNRRLVRRLSYGGLLVALIILLLALNQILPTANLFVRALTALCLAIAVIEGGVGMAATTYLAASLISLAWPGLAVSFPFIFFFGPYPLLRAIIDQHFGRISATLLKLVAGNILMAIAVFLFIRADVWALAEKFSFFWYVAPIAVQVMLLLFDFVLSLLIQFYATRIRRPS